MCYHIHYCSYVSKYTQSTCRVCTLYLHVITYSYLSHVWSVEVILYLGGFQLSQSLDYLICGPLWNCATTLFLKWINRCHTGT